MNSIKSYSNFISKSLFFLVFLPLLAPCAPNLLDQTIFTQFWESLYIIFIGFAVSYRFLNQKTVDVDTETRSSIYCLQRYESIFNECYEHRNYQSLEFENGYENDVFNIAKSQCFRDNSNLVVVGNVYKPLGLPVRSLNFVADRSELSKRSGSSFDNRNGKFGDLGPLNLAEKFNESDDLSSLFQSRSSSERMEISPSYFRRLGFDEFQSQSSFASRSSSTSYSSNKHSSSHSVSSELQNSDKEELETREMDYDTRLNSMSLMSETSSNVRRHSCIAPTLKQAEESKNMSFRLSFPPASTSPKPMMDDTLNSWPYKKTASLSKSSAGGKSVRTIREVKKGKSHESSDYYMQQKKFTQKQDRGKGKPDENQLKDPSKVEEVDYGDEVDKKAGEFIAKFREQIRIQKIASLEGSSIDQPRTNL